MLLTVFIQTILSSVRIRVSSAIVIRLVDEPLTLRRVKNPALWLRVIYRTLSDYHKTIACWLVEAAENHSKKQIQDLNLLPL